MTGAMFLVVMHTRGGRHKVYVQGHADGHLMDWNGCNFRFYSVLGQPQRGFATADEAVAFMQTVDQRAALIGARGSAGSYMADDQCCSCLTERHTLQRSLTRDD